ncbi:MAG: hypothetical protein XD77_0819 [Marinimicrobia bacterium 46_47]|nr:MAG: hypothetical protein XD77_0819 [Marinimicrobia bacterium 46_47]
MEEWHFDTPNLSECHKGQGYKGVRVRRNKDSEHSLTLETLFIP